MTEEPSEEEIQKLIAQKEALERQIQALSKKAAKTQTTTPPEPKPTHSTSTAPITSPAQPPKAFDQFDKEPLATLNAKSALVTELYNQVKSNQLLFISRLENNTLSLPQAASPADVAEVNRFKNTVLDRCKTIFHSKDIDEITQQLDAEKAVIDQDDARLSAKLTYEQSHTPMGNLPPELYSEFTQNWIRRWEKSVYSYVASEVKNLRAQSKHPESLLISARYLTMWLKGWGIFAGFLLVVGLIRQDPDTFMNVFASAGFVIVVLVAFAIYGTFASESARSKLKADLASQTLPPQLKPTAAAIQMRGGINHPLPISSSSYPNAWEAVNMALISTRHPNYGGWNVYMPARHLRFLKASWTFGTEFYLGNKASTVSSQVIDLLVTFEDNSDGTCDIILDYQTQSGGMNLFKSGDLDTLIETTTNNVRQLAPRQLIV